MNNKTAEKTVKAECPHYLAIDLGATSGRHILGWLENGELKTREIYRFKNGPVKNKDGRDIWDIKALFENVLEGMRRCPVTPKSVAIDSWGVDYALLDKDGNLIGDVYCYRDPRGEYAMRSVHEIIPPKLLYSITGIAPQPYNTIYQLFDDCLTGKLDSAHSFLMIPAYLNFLLTGVSVNEYTLATTTGLINAKTRTWDNSIISSLDIPLSIFTSSKCAQAGTFAGTLTQSIQKAVGYNTRVILPACHDTASAVASIQPLKNSLYISCGTWSIIGTTLKRPLISQAGFDLGYSNEGGAGGVIRFNKNIMGMWVLGRVRDGLLQKYSHQEVEELARNSPHGSTFNINDKRFFNPESMVAEIKNCLKQTGQAVPEQDGELFYCIYKSLAKAYAEAVEEIEKLTGKKYDTIIMLGGGARDKLLQQLTAELTKKTVVAGPAEATTEGNLKVQAGAEKLQNKRDA